MGSTIFEEFYSYIHNLDTKYNEFVDVVEKDFLGGVGASNIEFSIFDVPEVFGRKIIQ